MIFLIFVVMAAAGFYGAPVLPIFVVGALAQAGIAFALTKNRLCIHMATPVAMLFVSRLLVPELLQSADVALDVLHIMDFMVVASAALALFLCTWIAAETPPARQESAE